MNIFNQLKKKEIFSHNEQIIVDYILQNPEEILDMNTKQLSEKCFVSVATIYRLCEKIDISGFSDLKLKISNYLNEYKKMDEHFDFDFPIKERQTHYEIIQKLKEDYEKTLVSTASLFNLDQLKHAVNAIKRAKHIDIYTWAGNIYFAQNFMFQMKEIGFDVQVPTDDYMQKLTASSSDSSHLAMIISFEGRGTSSTVLPTILKNRNTPILLISSYDYKFKHFKPDYHLYISPYENHYRKISSFSTRLSILYILDVLYACFFELEYQKNVEKKLSYYEMFGSK